METADGNHRIFNIDKHIGLAICGRLPDGKNVVSRARKECDGYRDNFGRNLPGPILADRLANYIHAHTCYGQFRPLGIAVFLASIATGDPLGGVAVEVLAKNGVPLLSGQTAADGRVNFPSLGKPTREKKPVAFIARRGSDVAFMPYAREDRQLDFSRFDVGGVESRSGAELDAFVFTERGIYRPGDEIRIGLIVKQRDWAGKLDGLPVETEIIDARGTSVQVRWV